LLALTPEGTKALLADKGYDSSLYLEPWQQEALSQLFQREAIETVLVSMMG
jgi:hypothetical protein